MLIPSALFAPVRSPMKPIFTPAPPPPEDPPDGAVEEEPPLLLLLHAARARPRADRTTAERTTALRRVIDDSLVSRDVQLSGASGTYLPQGRAVSVRRRPRPDGCNCDTRPSRPDECANTVRRGLWVHRAAAAEGGLEVLGGQPCSCCVTHGFAHPRDQRPHLGAGHLAQGLRQPEGFRRLRQA